MTTIKLDEEFDFGFTSVDENDITSGIASELTSLSDDYKDRLHKMHKLITPLIDNLAAGSDTNAYIHWPNRKEKLIEFQTKLDELLKD